MRVVCFSGLDGAGKTTQLALLDALLRLRGLKTYYLWLRWSSLLTYPLYLYARLLKRTLVVETRARPVHIHVFWVDKVLQYLYPRLLLLDLLLRFLAHRLAARVKRAKVMLLDRSFLDAIVDLLWEVRSVDFLRSLVVRACTSLAIRMRAVILVVEPREAVRRKRDIVSIRELVFKKKCYEVLAKHLAIPLIDTTNKTPQETMRMIVGLLRPDPGEDIRSCLDTPCLHVWGWM